jgi:hypothetical protein
MTMRAWVGVWVGFSVCVLASSGCGGDTTEGGTSGGGSGGSAPDASAGTGGTGGATGGTGGATGGTGGATGGTGGATGGTGGATGGTGGGCGDTSSDPANCGACGNVCPSIHGTPSCVQGVCKITCSDGWGDCNGNVDDGCETDTTTVSACGSCNVADGCEASLSTVSHCGACNTPCAGIHATASCMTGTCALT